jgi:streptogramin lyase
VFIGSSSEGHLLIGISLQILGHPRAGAPGRLSWTDSVMCRAGQPPSQDAASLREHSATPRRCATCDSSIRPQRAPRCKSGEGWFGLLSPSIDTRRLRVLDHLEHLRFWGDGRLALHRMTARITQTVVTAVLLILCAAVPAWALSVRTIQLGSYSSPTQIIAGPNGALWVTGGGSVWRVTTAGVAQQIALPPIPGGIHDPTGIVSGPDGNIWFADSPPDGNNLGRVTPSGAAQEFSFGDVSPAEATGDPGNAGADVAVGSDSQLWFMARQFQVSTGQYTASIAHANTAGVLVGMVAIPGNPRLVALARGPDGNIWFTQAGPAGVDRITPAGALTQILTPFSPGERLAGLAAGPDGRVWVLDDGPSGSQSGRLARIAPDGAVSWSSIPGESQPLDSIARGSDGNMWITAGGGLLRASPAGAFASFLLPLGLEAKRITTGPDGNLWFTMPNLDSIATFTPRRPCHVPRVVGLTRDQASQQLSNSFCRLGKVRGRGNSNEVIAQHPAPGTLGVSGAAVSVVLGAPSRITLTTPRSVKLGRKFSLMLRGRAIGGGYTLDAVFARAPCAADFATEIQRSAVAPGPTWSAVHGAFRHAVTVSSASRGRHYICGYLTLGSLTTARGSASYLTS